MAAQASETFVLRTYPLKEADLIVSFFTRDQGKLRGVAKRARKPKKQFWSGLERLSQVKMFYLPARESRTGQPELLRADPVAVRPRRRLFAPEWRSTILQRSLITSCRLREPSERFFRLLVAVLRTSSRRSGRRPLAVSDLLQPLGCAVVGVSSGTARKSGIPRHRGRDDADADQPTDRTRVDRSHCVPTCAGF